MRAALSPEMPMCPYLVALETPIRKLETSRNAQGPSFVAPWSCPEAPPEINLMQICMKNECSPELMILRVIQPSLM